MHRHASIILSMILAITMMLSLPLSVFAIADHEGLEIDITSESTETNEPISGPSRMLRSGSGSDISGNQSFTVDNSKNSTAGYVVFQVGGFKGSCIQKGKDYELRGTAEMSEKGNTTLLAKAAYYVDNVKGWFMNSTDRPAIMDQAGVASRFRAGLLAEDVMQCANQGTDTWREKALAQTYPERYVNYVVNIVEDTLPGVTVPSTFIIWKGNPSDNSQDFAVWGNRPTGNLTVKKILSKGTTSPAFTFRITVAGASGTYSGVTFNNGVATITLSGGQSKTIEGLPAGANYTVTETAATNWHLVSKTNDSGKIGSGTTVTVSFTNARDTGFLKVKKQSGNKDITG